MKKIKVSGLNLNRLLDKIHSLGVGLKNVERLEYNEVVFEILDVDYKKLVANNILSCYNINVISSTPTRPILSAILKRLGLVVGLIMPAIIMFSVLTKIWNINVVIEGTADRDMSVVVAETLTSCGIGIGQEFRWAPRDLERQLISQIDECASAVVTRRGINLEISLGLRVNRPVQSEANIIASNSGKITDINLKSGILLVNIGEGVSAGQVLIASGTVGDYFAEANGEITANVLVSGEAVGATTTETMERTGAFVDVKAYSIFGKDWFWNSSVSDAVSLFEGAEVERTETVFSPLKLVNFRVYELKSKQLTVSKDALVEQLKDSAYSTAKSNLPKGAQELSVSYDIYNEGEIIKVVCNIETEINISVRETK